MFYHYVHNNFILLTWSKALLAVFVCVQTQRGHWTFLVDHQGVVNICHDVRNKHCTWSEKVDLLYWFSVIPLFKYKL